MNAETPDAGANAVGPTVARVRELIAKSSLGTPGAVALQQRTSPELSDLVRHLGDLRNRLAHSAAALTRADIIDLMWVADRCEHLGLHDTARWALGEIAAAHLDRIAQSYANEQQQGAADTWHARANTLHLPPEEG